MTGPRPPVLLVLRALKLGDFMTGIPALRALARSFPGHHRVLATPGRFGELLTHTGMHSILDTPDLGPLPAGAAGVDVAVDLHGRGPASQEVLLAARPRRLISFRSPGLDATAGHPVWRPEEHEVRRWCRLLAESGIPADPADLEIRPEPGPAANPVGPAGATIVHPGAASEARRWPPRRFAEVAKAEAEAGRDVIVTGSAAERARAESVARTAGLPAGAVVAGTTGLADLVATVASAGRVVCGDTGIAHVATATGTPSVVLFGPIPPSEWGPPPSPRHVALWAGRRGDPHADQVDPGLLRIGVEEVLDALATLPTGAGDRTSAGGRC